MCWLNLCVNRSLFNVTSYCVVVVRALIAIQQLNEVKMGVSSKNTSPTLPSRTHTHTHTHEIAAWLSREHCPAGPGFWAALPSGSVCCQQAGSSCSRVRGYQITEQTLISWAYHTGPTLRGGNSRLQEVKVLPLIYSIHLLNQLILISITLQPGIWAN